MAWKKGHTHLQKGIICFQVQPADGNLQERNKHIPFLINSLWLASLMVNDDLALIVSK